MSSFFKSTTKMSTKNKYSIDVSSIKDYDAIAPYIIEDPEGFTPEISLGPFVPDFRNIIIIDNIPIVSTEAKANKLKTLILKLYIDFVYSSKQEPPENSLFFPSNDATNESTGFCFLKCRDAEAASQAILNTQGYKLDSKHIFRVSAYSDLPHLDAVPDEYQAPAQHDFKPRPDPTSWLCDAVDSGGRPHTLCRDQFAVRFSQETEIHWGSVLENQETDVVYGGQREKAGGRIWCEDFVMWSPKGTYFVTKHPAGIKLWGGPQFEPYARFEHADVDKLEFSPCETYLVTYCYGRGRGGVAEVVVWDVSKVMNSKGTRIRSFDFVTGFQHGMHVEATITEGKDKDRVVRGKIETLAFGSALNLVNYQQLLDEKAKGDDASAAYFRSPIACTITYDSNRTATVSLVDDKVRPLQDLNRYKWSADGKYLARLSFAKSNSMGIIQVFELPSMKLLENKSIPAEDIIDFLWSPPTAHAQSSNLLSYWSRGVGNHPAQVNLMAIPQRSILSSRKLFDADECKMYWQDDADYLCVQFTKRVTVHKNSYPLMFFRVRESSCPVELFESGEKVLFVAWEPSGDRVAVVHDTPVSIGGASAARSISFYSMLAPVAQASASKSSAPKKEFTLLFSLHKQSCNRNEHGEGGLLWSPAGGVVAIADMKTDTCMFDLYDVDNQCLMTPVTRRHDRGNRLAWDPSGRTIASCTISQLRSTARAQPDDGFTLWSFQGTPITQSRKEKLYYFYWRPRPRDLLTREDRSELIKKLYPNIVTAVPVVAGKKAPASNPLFKGVSKLIKQFEAEDFARKNAITGTVLARRRELASSYFAFLAKRQSEIAAFKAAIKETAVKKAAPDDFETVVTFEETILEVKEEILAN